MSSNAYNEEEWECPLCMEEMDLADKNFKPCPCGYQVCRFCWHRIRENGNERCPACRRIYSDDAVEFTPVPQEEMTKMRQKKVVAKEKRQRELQNAEEAAAREYMSSHPGSLPDTAVIVTARKTLVEKRVIQRNLVYVIGIAPKIAK